MEILTILATGFGISAAILGGTISICCMFAMYGSKYVVGNSEIKCIEDEEQMRFLSKHKGRMRLPLQEAR